MAGMQGKERGWEEICKVTHCITLIAINLHHNFLANSIVTL